MSVEEDPMGGKKTDVKENFQSKNGNKEKVKETKPKNDKAILLTTSRR